MTATATLDCICGFPLRVGFTHTTGSCFRTPPAKLVRLVRAVGTCSRDGRPPTAAHCEQEARWCRERGLDSLRQNRAKGRPLGHFVHAWAPRDLFQSAAIWRLCAFALRAGVRA